MLTEKIINEILVRYGKNGEVQGMHVVYAFVVKNESGEIIAYNVGNPEAVTLGIEQGLNIDEVLGDLNALNLVNIELLTNQLAQANTQIQSLKADKNALISEKSVLITEKESLIQSLIEKNVEISILKERISELEAPKDIAKEEANALPTLEIKNND